MTTPHLISTSAASPVAWFFAPSALLAERYDRSAVTDAVLGRWLRRRTMRAWRRIAGAEHDAAGG